MPLCQNAPTVKYKGTEPSPKGTGFCARAENIGTKMKGQDGRMWVVKATAKGVKRWAPIVGGARKNGKKKFVPHHERMLNAVVDLRPLNFRMVIGYFHHKNMYLPSEGDTRPFATKPVLAKFTKGQKMWDYLSYSIDLPVSHNGHAYHQSMQLIKPKNVARVKVLSAPVHDPTFWEKLTGKHNGWWHKPDLVLVVDLVKVPVKRVNEKEARDWIGTRFQGMKNMDAGYWKGLAHTIRHVQNSSDGWINHQLTFTKNHKLVEHKESEPFKGQFRLLQMGPINETMPDYRKFE